MKFCKILLMFSCLITPLLSSTQTSIDLDMALIKAYQNIQRLKLDRAQKTLDSCKHIHNHPNIYFIENYIDFYTLFIGEEVSEYELRSKNKSTRLKIIANGKDDSPYYRYGRANILVQWALVNIKFENYFTAFRDISSAYRLLQKNDILYPNFKANKMILGVIHAIIGTIPDNYKWAAKLMGFNGTIAQGNDEIRSVLESIKSNDFLFSQEAIVLYTMVNLHLKNDQKKAWNILNDYAFHQEKGPLACFISTNVAMRTYNNDEALAFLKRNTNKDSAYPFHHLKLMKGMTLIRSLDPSCRDHLKNYVENFRGKSYIKEAYLYLAWQDLLFNNGLEYDHWITLCISRGSLQTDEDQNAYWEARSGILPQKNLLKARLLFDGGYWEKAQKELLDKITVSSLNTDQKIEYYYRLARIEELTGNIDQSIELFKKVIDFDKESHYLVCSSHLHLGFLYEMNKDKSNSAKSFAQCLRMNPNRYKTGLHQKAKAGLNRISQ